MNPPQGDRATVTVFVAVAPAEAFVVFTRDIDAWWKQGPKFRIGGRERGQLRFVGQLGGRLFESFGAGAQQRTVEVGRITAWEPPVRLAFEWRGVNFVPGESTLVEVRFEAVGRGAHVTVQHSGFSALRPDHPVRHGQPSADFIRGLGRWWGDLLTALREHVEMRQAP